MHLQNDYVEGEWKLSAQSHRHKYTVMQPLLSALLIIQRV